MHQNINKHDELLLKDLRFQPLWLLFFYLLVGFSSLALGFYTEHDMSKWFCAGGGFFVALGSEKLVSRRIRSVALALIKEKSSLN